MASCDHCASLKVSWKFIDPPGYDMRCALKSNVSAFSIHLFQEKCVTACELALNVNGINCEHRVTLSQNV